MVWSGTESTSSKGSTTPRYRCEVLSGMPEPVIHDGLTVNTGLSRSDLAELLCVGHRCLFRRRVRRDHGPWDEPVHRPEEQLLLHFEGRGRYLDEETYKCLKLQTAMVKPESHTQDGSGQWNVPHSNYLEVVGDFGGTDVRSDSAVGIRRLVPKKFDPSILRNWMSECESCHTHREWRQITAESSLAALIEPRRLRLINVSTRALIVATVPVRYLALSYVWGQPQASGQFHNPSSVYSKCADDTTEHPICIWKALPLTIRDAAELVKDIGERYLWVDAICINQNDPEDQRRIVSEMGTIYSCALATIVSAAEHAETGLSGISANSRNHERFSQISFGQQTLRLVRECGFLEVVLPGTR